MAGPGRRWETKKKPAVPKSVVIQKKHCCHPKLPLFCRWLAGCQSVGGWLLPCCLMLLGWMICCWMLLVGECKPSSLFGVGNANGELFIVGLLRLITGQLSYTGRGLSHLIPFEVRIKENKIVTKVW